MDPQIEKLIQATEQRKEAELQRAEAERARAAENKRLRQATEKQNSLQETLLAQIGIALDQIGTIVAPGIERCTAGMALLMELMRLLAQRQMVDAKDKSEIERLERLLVAIGKRAELQVGGVSVDAGEMTAGDILGGDKVAGREV